jgi:hypothetical protein
VPKTITSTTNAIKSDKEPARWATAGTGVAASGALAVSEGGLAGAADVAASAAAGLPVSGDGLTVVSGTVAAAVLVVESLRAWADGRGG